MANNTMKNMYLTTNGILANTAMFNIIFGTVTIALFKEPNKITYDITNMTTLLAFVFVLIIAFLPMVLDVKTNSTYAKWLGSFLTSNIEKRITLQLLSLFVLAIMNVLSASAVGAGTLVLGFITAFCLEVSKRLSASKQKHAGL